MAVTPSNKSLDERQFQAKTAKSAKPPLIKQEVHLPLMVVNLAEVACYSGHLAVLVECLLTGTHGYELLDSEQLPSPVCGLHPDS